MKYTRFRCDLQSRCIFQDWDQDYRSNQADTSMMHECDKGLGLRFVQKLVTYYSRVSEVAPPAAPGRFDRIGLKMVDSCV